MLAAVNKKSNTQLYKVYSKAENDKIMFSLVQKAKNWNQSALSTNLSTSLLKENRQLYSILTKDIAHKMKWDEVSFR